MTVEQINEAIAKLSDEEKNLVSDGYHSFKELYDHRCALSVFALNIIGRRQKSDTFEGNKAWKSRKNSNGEHLPGWFIAGIGPWLTYHLPDSLWDNLRVPEIEKGLWDGHTSKDVLSRLLEI